MFRRPTTGPTWLDAAAVAVVAATVRAVYLVQAASGPAFAVPLVDSKTYHNLAVGLATQGVYDERMLWQPAFYPVVLGGIYALVGVSIVAAKVIQAALGVGTALVAWQTGRLVGGRATGLGAGLGVALCGVLVFFEGELLATGWAAFWAALLLWLLVAGQARPDARRLVALGLVAALAGLTRPVLWPPAAVGVAWLVWRWRREGLPAGTWRRRVAVVAVAVAAVLGPVAWFNSARTGHAGLVPPSGGINLYIGNHPDLARMLTLRPGLDWEELVATPVRVTGRNDPWVSRRWFAQQVRGFWAQDPAGYLARLGRKTLHLLGSRELPRNVDVYLGRRWSPLLSVLVWKVGRFGFPMGVLLPLAAAGWFLGRRRLPAAVWLLPVAYGAGLVAVFVAARYRVVMVPWLAVAAAWGAVEAWRRLRAGRGRSLRPAAAVAVAVLLLGVVPGPFVQESIDTEPEMWHGIGYDRMHRQGDLAGAEAAFREAVRLDPGYAEAQNRLGVAIGQQHRYAEAIPYFEAAVVLRPGYREARENLALARRLAAGESR